MLCESKKRHQVDLHDSSLVGMMITLPKTNCKFFTLKIGRNPKAKDCLPSTMFQGQTVSFTECILVIIDMNPFVPLVFLCYLLLLKPP